MKKKEWCRVISQEELAPDIYSMWLDEEEMAAAATPGQFLSLYCEDGARLLPRPVSLCEIDREKGALRIVYRVMGGGTGELSGLREGDKISVMGVLGNGFPLEKAKNKKAVIIGGGIGIPPMVELAKQLDADNQIILGYRDRHLFLTDELKNSGKVYIATEDGSIGTKGNVLDAIRERDITGDIIFACGPAPMLQAIKVYAADHDVKCYLSLEERMACGIGACLGCVCRTVKVDSHSRVHNKRICVDGPVFEASEVEI